MTFDFPTVLEEIPEIKMAVEGYLGDDDSEEGMEETEDEDFLEDDDEESDAPSGEYNKEEVTSEGDVTGSDETSKDDKLYANIDNAPRDEL